MDILTNQNERGGFVRRVRSPSAAAIFAGLACWFCLSGAASAQPRIEASREYKIKAAFLYHFVRFIEWPEERFPDDQSPLVIGVLGANPFQGELEKAVAGRTVDNRPVQVRNLGSREAAMECHLVFVGDETAVSNSDLLMELGRRGVASVGESSAFIQSGGVIRFVLKENKVRFEINMSRARETNLRISAQLQKLATRIW